MVKALEVELSNMEHKFSDLCHSVVAECGLELYSFNYNTGSAVLQVLIMDPATGSAVIEDCIKVDHAFTPHLESEWVPDNLTLEVSSPGVFRPLISYDHFERAVGEQIQLTLKKRFEELIAEGYPRSFKGQKKVKSVLTALDEAGLDLEFNGWSYRLPFDAIKKANLEPEL